MAVVSKSVPLIIAAWVGAPCPPKNPNIRAFDFLLFQKVHFDSKTVPEEIRLHGLNWSVLLLIPTTLNVRVKLLALMNCIVEFMKFNNFYFFILCLKFQNLTLLSWLLIKETEVELIVCVGVLLQNKNNGKGCNCFDGSFGLETSACFRSFNG